MKLTSRENAFLDLCQLAGGKAAAIENCRKSLGKAMITFPDERANVAKHLADLGWDGIGRTELALADLNAAAKLDFTLLDCVAGR